MVRVACCALLFVLGCDSGSRSPREPSTATPSPSPSPKPQAAAPVDRAGGLGWDISPPFVRHVPGSPVRVAEYGVESDPRAELAVFYEGEQAGSIESNVQRWLVQIEQPDGGDTASKAKRSALEVGGLRVNIVEVSGIYTGPMAVPPSAAKTFESTLLGAIVSGPKGMVFFKLTGPRAAVESARYAFDRLLRSLRPE